MALLRVRSWRRKKHPGEPRLPRVVLRARRKFLKFFPAGFQDPTYLDWERNYKWEAHEAWEERLADGIYRSRLERGDFAGIAADAVRIESQTNLLFSFEKMALRDATRTLPGARQFAESLYQWLYGDGDDHTRFARWIAAVEALPRRQTRVLTWPVLTVFGFIARPFAHLFLKPMVTRRAAFELGIEFRYRSRPDWDTYESLLDLGRQVKQLTRDLRPRDMIDVQSFLWVQGSEEYD